MARAISKLAPGWWDYTTLDSEILNDAAALTAKDLEQLSRPGFKVCIYDTVEEFYTAEALEYIEAWQQATPDNPTGVCGPIGPTEHLPLVARIVNAIGLNLRDAHFWGMDEWVENGKIVSTDHPLSFSKCDREMCFDRIKPELRMPAENMHFPTGDLAAFTRSFDEIKCLLMQGGQGEIKHWAFNDPVKREGAYADAPPSPEEYRKLATRLVDLHPVTVIQNARTSGGGNVALVPTRASTVGPVETWKSAKVSIWHPGHHDNPFGIRLSALMISKRIPDSSVPMSLLADHPNVQFNYLRSGIGEVVVDMH
ncbi:MAG: glucosamine-6-phosphate isomerase [Kiritimatiellae bacterium]|jgi:glucosamine-6-phosphate deaminase|nr:glucosamine-6-phosphate isomerase [Kiritimatiellia bacterium]MDD2348190.1 glucosamine-6-phosphate isomerase [Kiritimatiellia bacterium]MDD3584991.1 glucosamine-6-phosphate isomerase [Kiritimatiellia bacterium]